jgi:hypothetical protein
MADRKKEMENYNKKNPWAKHYKHLSTRCGHKKSSYRKRGIKNFLNTAQVKFLWFRDKAYLMKQPSIDRINGEGNYTLKNCRFLEFKDNLSRDRIVGRKRISQFSKEGKFIKNWIGVRETAKIIKRSNRGLSTCLVGRQKTCGGYIWKYTQTTKHKGVPT